MARKKRNRVLSLVLTLAMVLGMLPGNAWAAKPEDPEPTSYTVDPAGAEVQNLTGKSTNQHTSAKYVWFDGNNTYIAITSNTGKESDTPRIIDGGIEFPGSVVGIFDLFKKVEADDGEAADGKGGVEKIWQVFKFPNYTLTQDSKVSLEIANGHELTEVRIDDGSTFPPDPTYYTVTYKAASNTSFAADVIHRNLLTGNEIPVPPAVTANPGYVLGAWNLVEGTEGSGVTIGTTNLVYELEVTPIPASYTVEKAARNMDGTITAPKVGDEIVYTITVTNRGAIALDDILVSDTMWGTDVSRVWIGGATTPTPVTTDGITIDVPANSSVVIEYSYVVQEDDNTIYNKVTAGTASDEITTGPVQDDIIFTYVTDGNGGFVGKPSASVTEVDDGDCKPAQVPTPMARPGYVFDCWQTGETKDNSLGMDTLKSATYTEDTTFVAHFKEEPAMDEVTAVPYNEVYDGQSHNISVTGAPEGADITYYSDEAMTTPFTGYTDVTDGAVTVYYKVTKPGYRTATGSSTVTITPAPLTVTTGSDSKVYDGNALTKLDGASLSGLVNGETATLTVTGSQTNAGSSLNNYEIQWSGTAKATNYEVKAESKGTLTVNPASLTIKIEGKTDRVEFDGQKHEINGYNVLTTLPAGVEVSLKTTGADYAEGTIVGNYNMGLDNESFQVGGGSAGNYIVTWDVTDGGLTIYDSTKLTVSAPDVTATYDAETHTTTATASKAGADITYVYKNSRGEVVAAPVDAGEYTVEITATLAGYADAKATAKVIVNKRGVTMTSATDSKTYDGTALENKSVTDQGFVPGEGAAYTVTGSQTEVGSSANTFTYELKSNTKASNYNITKVEGTLTVSKVNAYTVRWVNEDGTVLEIDENVPLGTMPSYNGKTPAKKATAQYTYVFNGWTPSIAPVTGDITYTAMFRPTTNQYTVTFWDGETLVSSRDYDYGDPLVVPEDLKDHYIGNYFYEFKGWTPALVSPVVASARYEAVWERSYVPPYIPNPKPNPDPDDEIDIPDEETPLAGILNVVDHFAYIVGYDGGLVKPTANITRAEVATIFFRLMTDEYRDMNWTTTNPFPDVKDSAWYNNAVSTSVTAGIVNGYPDGTFRPNGKITRAEFAAIAARFLSEAYDGVDLFTDIQGHWAQELINRAAAAGWIHGSEGKFRPNDYITRAEAMQLINNMLGRDPHKDHLLSWRFMQTWRDNEDTAKWYYAAVQEATNSHDYERTEDYEIWTERLPDRDWAALEKMWADSHDAHGGEVMD